MFVSHEVYGLRLAANVTIPGFPARHDSHTFDVRIKLKEQGAATTTFFPTIEPHLSSLDAEEHTPNFRVGLLPGSDYFGFFYADGARFAVERRGREVCGDWPAGYSLEDACTYLVGPVMGFVLRLRGIVCFHASAVVVGDCAIVLAGPPGAGKSTTAAAFACAGFPVLCDDVVALSDKGTQFLVQPGYPRLNLWPDSVRGLFGSEHALPRITPTWDKRYLPLGQSGHRFASSSVPLKAIYILGHREAALSGPFVEEISGKDAFMTLVANTYANCFLDQEMRGAEFEVLGRLVSSIPVRRVRPPAEGSAIFKVCEGIASDAGRLTTPVPANVSELS